MNSYWLLGKVSVPDDKKQEFNHTVLEILNLCGIRKTKEITLERKMVTVLEKPVPDQNGIVSFDYSIFEKKKRETSTYNCNTSELHTIDRGVGEFGLAMNLILLLQECYSNGSCYFMLDRKPVYIPAYMNMLCTILNRKVMINSRAKVWDIMLFMRNHPDCDMPDGSEVFQGIPWNHCELDHFQLEGLFASERCEIEPPENDAISDRAQISDANHLARMDYLYRIMDEEYQKSESGLENLLKMLLDSSLTDRMKSAEEQSNRGIISELSLYLHPASIVRAFALLKDADFWDTWGSLKVKGYKEVLPSANKKPKSSDDGEWTKHDFYKQILRDNQDEFLEFWDGENLALSDDMQKRVLEWKILFEETADVPRLDVPKYLADILSHMEHDWQCRYADAALVGEILERRDDSKWRRALLLLRRVMDGDRDLYPELDREMAISWIKTYRLPSDINAAAALCSLLTNKTQRLRIFGF